MKEKQIVMDRIYNEDCLVGMQRITDGSVDCIICDLPYEVLNKGNKSAQWDRLIPFDKLWEQYERIIKPNGAIVLFGSGMFTAKLMTSNEKLWRYNLIWKKGYVFISFVYEFFVNFVRNNPNTLLFSNFRYSEKFIFRINGTHRV